MTLSKQISLHIRPKWNHFMYYMYMYDITIQKIHPHTIISWNVFPIIAKLRSKTKDVSLSIDQDFLIIHILLGNSK